MALKLITPATELAVSLADAKLHLRVDGPDEDTLIKAYIMAATKSAEQATGRAIMPQTWELTLDAFPTAFELTRVPVASVTSVKYYDDAGVLQTLGTARYTLDNADDYGPSKVVPVYGDTWPSSRAQINAVAVRYLAGWPDAASVPDSIKAWILLRITDFYENRVSLNVGNITSSLGFADSLLDPYRIWNL